MSWTAEEWKVGLPSRALQKIAEREQQLEKLVKEKQQKQLQLEALETALHKQKQKLDEGRSDLATAVQEKQSLAEACSSTERARQRLAQELQVKDAQVCSLQGQLSAARKEISSLEQELKRCRAELEKLQASGQLREAQLFPTPPWSCNGSPLSAREDINVISSGRVKDSGVSIVGQQRAIISTPASLSIRQQLLFSSSSPLGSPNRRESSGFPWQEESSPVQRMSTPRRGASTSQFPWGQDPPSTPTGTRPTLQTGFTASAEAPGKEQELNAEEPLKRENEELRRTVSQLQSWAQAQQQEDQVLSSRCQNLQRQLDETRGDLATREQQVSKCQEELQRHTVQQEQTEAKRASLEQKLRHLAEDLKCQRQNSEATRLNLEQRMKEKEKEHQQEIAAHQQQCLALEQQHLEECTRLRRELQQAKSSGHTLQAQVDELRTLHLSGEKELDKMRGMVRQAEQEISSSRSWVQQLQADLEAAKRQESALPSVGPLSERITPQEEETRWMMGKQSHGTPRQTARQMPSAEGRWQDRSEETTSASREGVRPRKVDCQNGSESGNRTADNIVEDVLEEMGVSALVPKTEGKAARGPRSRVGQDSDALQQSLKKQFEVHPGGMGPSSPEETALPAECIERTFQSNKEESADTPRGPDGRGQVSARSDGSRTEDRALQCELLEFRKKLQEAAAESELRQKALFETRWKLKQTGKKYATETGRLKKQVLELMEKLSNLEADLESERHRCAGHQQKDQALEDECRRLSELLDSKENIIQQMGAEVKTLERELLGLEKVESKALEGEKETISKSSSAGEHREEVGGLEGRDPDPPPEGGEEEEFGSDRLISNDAFIEMKDGDLRVLGERGRSLGEHLEIDKDNEKVDGSEGERTLSQEQGEPASEMGQKVKALQARCEMVFQEPGESATKLMEQKVKVLQTRCEMLSAEKLEADARASEMQQKFNRLQTTINLQTQQLTLAFETQTQNIDDLLLSLEEKEAHIATLNQTLEQYCQSLADLQAQNAELWAVMPHPSLEKEDESYRVGDSTDGVPLEYAILGTKQRILESGRALKEEEDSIPRDAGSSPQEAVIEGLVHPEFLDERRKGWAIGKGEQTDTKQGSSLIGNCDEGHSPEETRNGVRGPVNQLDYLQGSEKNRTESQKHGVHQGEDQEDQAIDTPSGIALLNEVCLSQQPSEKLHQGLLSDPSRGLPPIEAVSSNLSTIDLVAPNQGKVRSSQAPAEQERETVPPNLATLLTRCLGLEQERDMLKRKLLELQLFLAVQQPDDRFLEVQPETQTSLRHKGPEKAEGLRNDLDKAQKVLPLSEVEETGTRTVMEEALEELHLQMLQNQCCSLQRIVAEAERSDSIGAPVSNYAVLQHQVDVMCRMVSDLLDGKPPLKGRLDPEAQGSKTEPLERKASGMPSQDTLEGDTKLVQPETTLCGRDTGGESCRYTREVKSRPWQSEMERWKRGDGGIACRVSQDGASKILLGGDDVEGAFPEGSEVECMPLTDLRETWGKGDGGTHLCKNLENGGTALPLRPMSGGTQVVSVTLPDSHGYWGTRSETECCENLTKMERPSEPQAQGTWPERERPFETKGLETLPEAEREPEPKGLQRLPERVRLSGTWVQERPPEREMLSEPLTQENLPEAESQFDTKGLEVVPERPSELQAQESLQERESSSEPRVQGTLPETERLSEPRVQDTLPQTERQSEKELGRLAETREQLHPEEVNAQSVRLGESKTQGMQRLSQGVDNGMKPDAERVSTAEVQPEAAGAALLCFSPEHLERKPCRPDPGSPGTVITQAPLLCPRIQTLGPEGSDRFDQQYSDLVEGYQTLQNTNCTLSKALYVLQEELKELREAAKPGVRHSETQTELLEGTPPGERCSAEGKQAPGPVWRGDPAEIARRLQRQREKMSVAYDDTEYEPYGLPEVVMKGFADIPTGPACPYVLRRGLLGSSLAAIPKQSTESSPPAPDGGSSV